MIDRLTADYDARDILSTAKMEALIHALNCGRLGDGGFYKAIETWRWVANAYDHVHRAVRLESGLTERGDPCLPS